MPRLTDSFSGSIKKDQPISQPISRSKPGVQAFRVKILAVLAAFCFFMVSALWAWPTSIAYEIRFDEAQVVTLAFTDEGDALITGHADGTVAIRDADDGDVQRSFKAHKGRVYQLDAQLNGELIATGTLGKDQVKVWNSGSGELKYSLSQFDETFGLAFSSDNKFLVISGARAGRTYLELWNIQTGSKVSTLGSFAVNDFVPGKILFSSDSQKIFVSAQNRLHGIHIWSVNGQKLKTIPYSDDIISMSLHQNESIAVGATFKSQVVVIDLNTGRVLRTMSGHKGHVTSVARIDEHHAVSVSYKRDPTGPFIIWDIRTGNRVATVSEKISSINQVAVNPKTGDIVLALNTFGNLGNPSTLVVYEN